MLFSQFDEDYRSYLDKFAVWRLIRKVGQLAREMEVPVRAINETGDPRLLKRLGFVMIADLGYNSTLYEFEA